ncbi:hypothetical protein VaNZ11_004792 [Volvox africanus]|uniref:Aprataxin C2HE/C2H2/C2HC zinc finger domain-containing protein n=1 Tax=Volvox africanus TaxID=51714 RepID=A0ABQ5RXQ4_9CHLO|nr:hypothetical protein VaNZ11_004792 [Volvox africanus]
MAKLLFPEGKLIPVPLGVIKSLGRANVARCCEAVTVSRVQCTVKNIINKDGQHSLKLTSQGSQNPTVVIRTSGQNLDLHQGQSALLGDGASFSLISTRPDLSITVLLDRDPQEATGDDSSQPSAVPGVAEGNANVTMPINDRSETTTEPARSEGDAAQEEPVESGVAEADPVAMRRKVTAATAKADSYSSPSEADASDGGGGSAATAGEDGGSDIEWDAGVLRGATKKSSALPPTGGSTGTGQGRSGGGKGGKAAARGVGNDKPLSPLAPPVLLLLSGLPGSGKSTFSRELLATSPVAWVHVNQDAIRDGRPGTRQQCISAVRTALEDGACCVVDRCHVDTEQRSALRAVALGLGLTAHCVALQTPLEVCVKRVAGRSDHPGGVQGEGSKKVVYMAAGQMKGNNWPPAASEGFASVMDCHNDADAAAAVRAWALYGTNGASETQASGSVTARAMKDVAEGTDDGNRNNENIPRAPVLTVAVPVTHAPPEVMQKMSAAAADVAVAATLAMWREYVASRKPVTTGIMSFLKRARTAGKQGPGGAGAAVAAIPAAKEVASRLIAMNGNEERSEALPGAITARTPANEDSKGAATGKGPVEAGVKGGPGAGIATQSRPRRLRTEAMAVGAGDHSAKRQKVDGAQAGRGSNVDGGGGAAAAAGQAGNRPGSVQMKAKDAAGSAGQGHGQRAGQGGDRPTARNAFAVLLASASRQAADGHECTRGGAGSGDDAGLKQLKHRHGAAKATGDEPDPRFKLSAPWAQALRNTALHPEEAQQDVLYKDDLVVLIRDVFPKAKHHALVVARDPMLRSIADLRKLHLPMLAHMKEVALRWVQEERSKDPITVAFKLGFHSVPSMAQLHMHAVSQDFNSPALKNKKHWNSFTTRFFLPLHVVESELASRGHLTIMAHAEQEQLEGQELRCHGCSKSMTFMAELKKHIATCDAVKRLPGI